MFGLITKIFIVLLCNIVNGCKIQPYSTLIKVDPNEYSQEFQHYPFAVKFSRCVGSCNTLNHLSNKICVANKTDLNLSRFSMITRMNKTETLTKHISHKCKNKFDGKKYNSNQWWNNDKCR